MPPYLKTGWTYRVGHLVPVEGMPAVVRIVGILRIVGTVEFERESNQSGSTPNEKPRCTRKSKFEWLVAVTSSAINETCRNDQ